MRWFSEAPQSRRWLSMISPWSFTELASEEVDFLLLHLPITETVEASLALETTDPAHIPFILIDEASEAAAVISFISADNTVIVDASLHDRAILFPATDGMFMLEASDAGA